jgi:hypothetical protein
MEAIREIIRQYGYPSVHELPLGTPISRSVPGYMELCIEKILCDRVCVGHYYWQRGDRLSDPEIEFKITSEEWIPSRFTQDPLGHQYEEDGLSTLASFIEQWNENLIGQGFTTAPADNDSNR